MSMDPKHRGSLPGATASTEPEVLGSMRAPGVPDVDADVQRARPPDGPESTLPYLEMALTQGDEAWIDEIARQLNAPPQDEPETDPDARQANDVTSSSVVAVNAEDAIPEDVGPPRQAEPVGETPAPISAVPLPTPPIPEPLPRVQPRRETAPGKPFRRSRTTWRLVPVALGLVAIVAALVFLYQRRSDADAATGTVAATAAEPGAGARGAASAQPARPAPAAAAATGRLVLGFTATRVFVDGSPDSRSPVATYDLPPGDHAIRLETPSGTVRRTVRITAGQETWLPLDRPDGTTAAAKTPTATPSTGWLRVSAPVEMQMFEGERFLGTTRVDRMLIEAGAHDVTLVAEGIGYRETHRVTVRPGATTSLGVTLPPGRLSVNAVPWANVFIDGQPAGETPIGNLEVSSGPHEIRLVHPTLGEVTRTLVVKVGEPARLGVDMRKK